VRLALFFLLAFAIPAQAQRLEITPFVGVRTGGVVTGINGAAIVDNPGGASAGVLADVVFGPLDNGIKVEGLFSRQQENVRYSRSSFDPPGVARITIDQFLVGGVYDLSAGRVRPFLSGGAGLTRAEAPDVTTLDFMLAGGAGVKFFANRHIGARLDGRLYVTILGGTAAGICNGGCAIGFSVSPSAQVEFTAGLVVGF
jgi:hypothetical protein